MTDLASPKTTSELSPADTELLDETPPNEPDVQWAESEPEPKKKHLGLWIGIPAALVVAGLVAASFVVIAPGTTIAGAPVGFQTVGGAQDSLNQRLADTTITLGEDGPTISASDLGATVDAEAIAAATFDERPAWNVSQWFGDNIAAPITIDPSAAEATLREAAPDQFVEAVNASISYEGGQYLVTPAESGEGIDVATVTAALEDGFSAGETAITVEPGLSEVEAQTSTESAQAVADELNGVVTDAGFYVGDEEVVGLDQDEVASWITVNDNGDGGFDVDIDSGAIQARLDDLAGEVNQDAVNGSVITNEAGETLSTIKESQDGRELDSVDGLGETFAGQLAEGNGHFELPVTVTEAETTTTAYLLEVDLSDQMLYVKENGETVDSWAISSGMAESPTFTGHFAVNWHVRSQTMSSVDPDNPYWNYEVENVEWVMYFNGDQAFHGVYWHNNWGTPSSHGCVGMSNERAEQIYEWAPQGTDVWIHD